MGLFTRRDAATPAPRALTAAAQPNPVSTFGAPAARTYGSPRPLVAAARPINPRDPGEVKIARALRKGDDWQTRAWDYYDAVGEIKYAAGLVGAVTSRLKIYPAVTTAHDQIPTSLVDAVEPAPGLAREADAAIAALGTCNGGIPGAMRDLAINLFVAGEANLVGTPARLGAGTAARWQIASVDELAPIAAGRRAASGQTLWALRERRSEGERDLVPLPEGTTLCRVWRPHPRFSAEADSSLLGLLDPLEQLLLLQRAVRGSARSRLNAGLLYLPDGIAVAGGTGGDGELSVRVAEGSEDGTFAPLSDAGSEDVEEALSDALSAPIADEGAPSSLVPVILRGPNALGEQIRHITFERPFDNQLTEQADRLIDRILAGLDLPKDVVSGLRDVRYSNAVQIEESFWKAHIEPLALLICDALTVGFLRPWLRAAGYTETQVAAVVLWYDPSSVTTKPGLAEAADAGYDKKIVSADAWRRAHGFAEGDAPTPTETAQRIAIDRGPLSEPVAEALLRQLIPDLLDRARADAQGSSAAPIPADVESVLNPGAAPATSAPATTTPAPAPTRPTTNATPAPTGDAPVTPTGIVTGDDPAAGM